MTKVKNQGFSMIWDTEIKDFAGLVSMEINEKSLALALRTHQREHFYGIEFLQNAEKSNVVLTINIKRTRS